MEKNTRPQQIRELVGAGEQKRDSIFNLHNNQSIVINFITHDDEAEQELKSQLIGAEAS